jgi:hypothetical protein
MFILSTRQVGPAAGMPVAELEHRVHVYRMINTLVHMGALLPQTSNEGACLELGCCACESQIH